MQPTRPNAIFAEQSDTEALIACCLRGDAAAQAIFINRYATLVRRAVLRQLATLGDPQPLRSDVDDLCNDVFTRLLSDGCRRLNSVRDLQRLDAWLMVTTRNHVLEHLRKYRRETNAHAAAPHEPNAQWTHLSTTHALSPDTHAVQREERESVQRLLEALSPRERLAIQLYYFDGMRYAEIAETTNQNINTIAAQIHRAKERLRLILAQTPAEPLSPPDEKPAPKKSKGGRHDS